MSGKVELNADAIYKMKGSTLMSIFNYSLYLNQVDGDRIRSMLIVEPEPLPKEEVPIDKIGKVKGKLK